MAFVSLSETSSKHCAREMTLALIGVNRSPVKSRDNIAKNSIISHIQNKKRPHGLKVYFDQYPIKLFGLQKQISQILGNLQIRRVLY